MNLSELMELDVEVLFFDSVEAGVEIVLLELLFYTFLSFYFLSFSYGFHPS